MNPGEYYPRIWRGNDGIQKSDYPTFFSFQESFQIILQMLQEIFLVVQPTDGNKSAYGHKFRHILILTCTEIEASWRGILEANNYQLPTRPNTNDYVKLCGPLRLNEYKSNLWTYRHGYTETLEPFAGWCANVPTTSIDWYQAYHDVKHDREGALHRANLENTINATSALFILGLAQFGPKGLRGTGALDYRQMVFGMGRIPSWDSSERYVAPNPSSRSSQIYYPF